MLNSDGEPVPDGKDVEKGTGSDAADAAAIQSDQQAGIPVISTTDAVDSQPSSFPSYDTTPPITVGQSIDAKFPQNLNESESIMGECRICLLTETPEDMVKPCACSGSVQLAHMKCLKQWCREKMALKCEICGQVYSSSVIEQLMPVLHEAQAAHMCHTHDRVTTQARALPTLTSDHAATQLQRLFAATEFQVNEEYRRMMNRVSSDLTNRTEHVSAMHMRRKWSIYFMLIILAGVPLFLLISLCFEIDAESPAHMFAILFVCMSSPMLCIVIGVACVRMRRRTLNSARDAATSQAHLRNAREPPDDHGPVDLQSNQQETGQSGQWNSHALANVVVVV